MKSAKQLIQAVELCNQRHSLFQKHDALLLGVSGGPDSTALLVLLGLLSRKYSLKLTAAHLNHGLLPRAAKKYEAQVKQLCAQFSIPLHLKRIKLRKSARRLGRSLEESGRMERYGFFEKTASKTKSTSIVTAHTLDDQAETVLMRLVRGSGVKGLSGIPYKRNQGRFRLIRPLLDIEKKDLIEFLDKNKISFCLDKTNQDTAFSRNRVRHRLLCLLESDFNPNIKRSLSNLQLISRDIQDCIEKMALKALNRCRAGKKTKEGITLRIDRLKKEPLAIQREVILRALEAKQGHLKRIEYSHIAAVLVMAGDHKNRRLEIHLPNSIRVTKNLNLLTLNSNKTIIHS